MGKGQIHISHSKCHHQTERNNTHPLNPRLILMQLCNTCSTTRNRSSILHLTILNIIIQTQSHRTYTPLIRDKEAPRMVADSEPHRHPPLVVWLVSLGSTEENLEDA